MKKVYFLFVSIGLLSLVACSQSQDTTKEIKQTIAQKNNGLSSIEEAHEAFLLKKLDFQQIETRLSYCSLKEVPNAYQSVEGAEMFEACEKMTEDFIAKSGFPVNRIDIDLWKTTWKDADKLYKSFYQNNKENSSINYFRTHASIIILKDLGLLAGEDKESLKAIEFYTQELVDAGFVGGDFVYYCIGKLVNYSSNELLKNISLKAAENFKNDDLINEGKRSIQKNSRITSEHPAMKYLENEEKYASMLQRIGEK